MLGNPDADQVAADVVSFGEPVEGLAGQIVLDDLPLELDRIAAVLGHGLSPRKPGRNSLIRVTSPVHPVGCTPEYAKIWPNITVKKTPPPDWKEWEGKADKLQYFSPNPGSG